MDCLEDAVMALCDDGYGDLPLVEQLHSTLHLITYGGLTFCVTCSPYASALPSIKPVESAAYAAEKAMLVDQWWRLLMCEDETTLHKQVSQIITGLRIDSCPFLGKHEVKVTDYETDTMLLLERVLPFYKKVAGKRRSRLASALLYAVVYVCDNFNQHCYVCGRVSAGFCGNAFCRYRLINTSIYQNMINISDRVALLPALCAMLRSSLASKDAELILEGCPELFKTAEGKVNIELMKSVLAVLTSAKKVVDEEPVEDKKPSIGESHLQWWLLNLPSVSYTLTYTDHYVITLDSEKLSGYAAFAKMAKDQKTISVYHGSVLSAWISIMNNGLHIMSNTAHMRNGAVHGPGIYSTPSIDVAKSYSARESSKVTCVAEIEVVDVPEGLKRATSDIYVVLKDQYMLMRRIHIWT